MTTLPNIPGEDLSDRIVGYACRLGFDLVAITSASVPHTIGHYREWIGQGFHGEMSYLARADAEMKRGDLRRVLPGARTVVTVAANYHCSAQPRDVRDDPSRGAIAQYALGADYHQVLTPRLEQLGNLLVGELGPDVSYRAYVDTGPLLERALATRAGLGFIGKNTCLIHPRLGSWLFLGELLLTVDVPVSAGCAPPLRMARESMCGRCTRCLEACPTHALVAPYVLDARRCISYLTIEAKGPIPRELRPLVGNRIFGCDLCQEVCPWNLRFARPALEPAFQPRHEFIAPYLSELATLDDSAFRQRFAGSAIERAKRRGLLRNVAVALGNWADPAAIPPLARALHDPEPLVRGHAAWALGRIADAEARRTLQTALPAEPVAWVREEIDFSLSANAVV